MTNNFAHIFLFFEDAAKSGSGLTDSIVLIVVGGIFGGGLTAFWNWLFNKPQMTATVHETESKTRKNDAETIAALQGKLLEVADKITDWIGKFETAKGEAIGLTTEIADLRRSCDDCMRDKKSLLAFCLDVKGFFGKLDPILSTIQEAVPLLRELQKLQEDLTELQEEFEADKLLKGLGETE